MRGELSTAPAITVCPIGVSVVACRTTSTGTHLKRLDYMKPSPTCRDIWPSMGVLVAWIENDTPVLIYSEINTGEFQFKMRSFPARHHGSDKAESITEIFHGKFLPVADSCPLRIDVNRVPLIEEIPARLSTTKKPSISPGTKRLILPAIRSRSSATTADNYLRIKAEQELQELDASYRPPDCKARDIGEGFGFTGPSACQTDFDHFMQESLEVVLERREEKADESNALRRWEFWMKDKKRVQEYLGRRLQKNSNNLLLQDSDKIRRKLEERWLSTCNQIPEPDRWRGHPFRWKAEFRLPNRKIKWNEPKAGSPPQYCATRTSLDKGEIPDTEFIGIPRTIQKEKGFILKHSPDTQFELAIDESQYYARRRRMLKPNDSDMDALEVIGKKMDQPKTHLPRVKPEKVSLQPVIPEIAVHGARDSHRSHEDPSIFCLRIGEDEIKYEMDHLKLNIPTRTFHWKVDFALNTVGALAERVLRVENRGTVAIQYFWLSEKPQKPINLEKLQPRQYEPWFFFNKNSGFFLPGQIYHLKFYHHSKFSGIRKEVWHLKTEPPMSLSSDPCTVTLSAIATEEFSSRNPLEKYLFDRVKASIVESMIDFILDKVLRPPSFKGIEYRSLFSSQILFEYNNPTRYYNSTIVSGLNRLYEEITPGLADWDLSLDTLVHQVKARRIGKDRNTFLSQVAEKAKLLLKPNNLSVSNDKKYRMAYDILCQMANYVEEDHNFFKHSISQNLGRGFVKRPRSTEESSSAGTVEGEYGEYDYYGLGFEMNPVNLLFLRTMFYLKVYFRMCHAVEYIAGMLETRKLFEPWRKIDYRVGKPERSTDDLPHIPNFTEFE